MSAIGGIAMLASAFALLRAFRPASGVVVRRSEWIEVLIAVTVTAALGCGGMLVLTGIAKFWSLPF